MSDPYSCYQPGFNYINENCGFSTILLDGCICLVNRVSGLTSDVGKDYILQLTTVVPGESSGTYTATGFSDVRGGLPGGGALVSSESIPGYFSCGNKQHPCFTLTAHLKNSDGPTLWYGTLSGQWGETLTVTGPTTGSWSGKYQITLCLNTKVTDCGGSTTYSVSGGTLTIT